MPNPMAFHGPLDHWTIMCSGGGGGAPVRRQQRKTDDLRPLRMIDHGRLASLCWLLYLPWLASVCQSP